jgi:BA14K-like protein
MLKNLDGDTLHGKGHSSTAIQGIIVMRILVMATAMGVMSGFSAQAFTNPQTYCELFSKDYADSRTLDVDEWQAGYRNAFSSCMAQYTSDAPDITKTKSAEKTVKKVTVTPARDTVRRKRTPLLAPGSVAWNEYCAAKYTSFNKATGTYKSYSGRAKPCLVPSG